MAGLSGLPEREKERERDGGRNMGDSQASPSLKIQVTIGKKKG